MSATLSETAGMTAGVWQSFYVTGVNTIADEAGHIIADEAGHALVDESGSALIGQVTGNTTAVSQTAACQSGVS